MGRRRLDSELVRRGLVASPEEARAAIRAGQVVVAGRHAETPGSLIAAADPVLVLGPRPRFVSRGGDKLDAAIDRFGIDVAGRACLDAGASSGGFTDCLLRRGAARVVAVDVGYGQLAWTLRTDPRVVVLERTNVRELSPAVLPFAPTVVVADLSFVSLALAIPPLAGVSARDATFVLLVKPQFEADRAEVGPGGVVRDPAVWRRCLRTVAEACARAGLAPLAAMASPLVGPAGNVEFFLHAAAGAVPGGPSLDLGPAIAEAERIGGTG